MDIGKDKKRFIVIGSGYVGNRLKVHADVIGKYDFVLLKLADLNAVADHIKMDRMQYLKQIIRSFVADGNVAGIVNCVGYTGRTNVDDCLYNKEICFDLNVVFPTALYNFVHSLDIPYHQISTGCIYTHNNYDSNYKPNHNLVFTEESRVNFGAFETYSSFYSKTKHQFEMIHAHSEMYQWRIRMPYDTLEHRKNIIVKLTQNYPFICEEKNSVTNLETLYHCITKTHENDYFYGIYNCVDDSFLTSDLVRVYDDVMGEPIKRTFVSYRQLVESGLIKENRSNCILSNEKIKNLGVVPRVFLDDVATIAKQWKNDK